MEPIVKGIYWVLYLLKFKAVNYNFPLSKPGQGGNYSLMAYSVNSLIPKRVKMVSDSGYILVLPKIEIYNDAKQKVREIGSYCVPISLVAPLLETSRTERNPETQPSSQINRPRPESGDERSRSYLRQSVTDDAKTATKPRENRARIVAGPSEQEIPKKTEMYVADKFKTFNNWQDPLSDEARYSPNAFKHLRSIDHYSTPDVNTPQRQTQDLHGSSKEQSTEGQGKPRADEFSFDIYSQQIGGMSPLDQIERHLLLDDSMFNTSEDRANNVRPQRKELKSEIERVNPRKEGLEAREPRAKTPVSYTPPFKENVVLNQISESPLPSPNYTNTDQKRSSEREPGRRRYHERSVEGAQRDSSSKPPIDQRNRPTRYTSIEEVEVNQKSYPGSLVGPLELRK